MKKIGLLVCLLFILPFGVFAATNPNVKELNTKVDGTTISYNGTMEDGSHAVMCKLYNSKGEEVKLLSSAVDKTKFEGEFVVNEADTYVLGCANYEGGEIKKVEVKVEEKTTTNSETKTETKTNPKTGDNYTLLTIILVISIIGLLGGALYLKKKKAVKNN